MVDEVRKFETVILRPLFVIFLVVGVITGLDKHWWILAGTVGALFFLGVIGSGLHPSHTSSELASGPLAKPPASDFPQQLQLLMLGQACTKVGALVGVTLAIALCQSAGLAWYIAIPIAIVTMIFTSAVLKIIFKVVQK